MAYSSDNIKTRVQKLVKNVDIDLLAELVTIVEDYCRMFLAIDIIPDQLESLIVEIVIARYNKLGSEGFSVETVEGVSVQYIDFVEAYAPMLMKYRKLKTI